MPGGVAVPALPPTSARASGEAIETAFAPCIALCRSVSRLTVSGLLCLRCKEVPHMASVRCIEVQAHPTECLDVTSVTSFSSSSHLLRGCFKRLWPYDD